MRAAGLTTSCAVVSGRQGDPGESKFFISLEDDLMRLFGNNERIIAMIDRLGVDEDTPIQARILSNTIESAQKRIEDQNFKRRKYVLAYDDVMNQQRNLDLQTASAGSG